MSPDSKNFQKRNGFFLAALESRIDIMFYLNKRYPALTCSTDMFEITCSFDPDKITCPHMDTNDDLVSIDDIDSVSQTGVLKQRQIVGRLRKSVRLLNKQTGDEYDPTGSDQCRQRNKEPDPTREKSKRCPW